MSSLSHYLHTQHDHATCHISSEVCQIRPPMTLPSTAYVSVSMHHVLIEGHTCNHQTFDRNSPSQPIDLTSSCHANSHNLYLLLLFGCPGCPFFGGFLVLFFSYSFRGFYLTPILVSRPDHPQVDATGHLMAQILYLIQKKKGILMYLNIFEGHRPWLKHKLPEPTHRAVCCILCGRLTQHA